MKHEWDKLTTLTQGQAFSVERVRITNNDIAIEGDFQLPPLAQLTPEDQAFVTAFIHCHGSIKQMEEWFGISYPTVKNRLKAIGKCLPLLEHLSSTNDDNSTGNANDILDQLENGEITPDEAADLLRGTNG